jgi:hypothetical protein
VKPVPALIALAAAAALGAVPFAQQSRGAFDAANVVVDRDDPPIRRMLDFDIDGDLDTDTVLFGAVEYRVLRRTGAGNWQLEPNVLGGPAEFLRAVEGDGALDGACCGGGGGLFQPGGRLPTYRAIRGGDIDLDGDLDLIGSGGGYEGTSTYLYVGSDAVPGRLPTMTWTYPDNWHQQTSAGIAAADFDGDGYPEFAMLFTEPSAFIPRPAMYNNRFPDGGRIEYEIGLSNGVSHRMAQGARVSVADLDGDGDTDLLGERIVFNRSNP